MSVGKRIETFRIKKELSVEKLAELAGISVQVLRAIEKDEVTPAIGVLVKLARSLGQRLGSFMDDQFQMDPLIVRKQDRASRIQNERANLHAYEYSSLGQGKPDRHAEPFYVRITSKEHEIASHEGEEFLYVVSGQLELVCGNRTEVLNPGDTAYYNSLLPHSLRTMTDEPVELVAVIVTPF